MKVEKSFRVEHEDPREHGALRPSHAQGAESTRRMMACSPARLIGRALLSGFQASDESAESAAPEDVAGVAGTNLTVVNRKILEKGSNPWAIPPLCWNITADTLKVLKVIGKGPPFGSNNLVVLLKC